MCGPDLCVQIVLILQSKWTLVPAFFKAFSNLKNGKGGEVTVTFDQQSYKYILELYRRPMPSV